MYIYIYIYYVYIYTYICIDVHAYYICIDVHACVHTLTDNYLESCVCVCVYIYTYTYIDVDMCVHTLLGNYPKSKGADDTTNVTIYIHASTHINWLKCICTHTHRQLPQVQGSRRHHPELRRPYML